LHSIGPYVVPMLIGMQVIGHEVLREAPLVVKEVPAKVQEKDLLVVGVSAETVINGHVQSAERIICRGTAGKYAQQQNLRKGKAYAQGRKNRPDACSGLFWRILTRTRIVGPNHHDR